MQVAILIREDQEDKAVSLLEELGYIAIVLPKNDHSIWEKILMENRELLTGVSE
jgi:hypothetical protein